MAGTTFAEDAVVRSLAPSGHPLGMTGTRLLLTLALEMRRRHARRGVAAACIGGGQGIAALIEGVG